jgi:hypothetical protein
MLLDLLTAAVLAFVGVRLVGAARVALAGRGRERIVAITRGVRARHLLGAPVALTGVAVAASVLVQVPGLDVGWWTAIGGVGNPVTGGSERTVGTTLEWLLPIVFLVLLLPALPLFAEREEQMFRAGAEHWSTPRRLWRGALFGLVHAVIGIPIGVALALSVGGWYFTWWYLRAWRATHSRAAALLESTRAHLAYNLFIVGLILLAAVLGA